MRVYVLPVAFSQETIPWTSNMQNDFGMISILVSVDGFFIKIAKWLFSPDVFEYSNPKWWINRDTPWDCQSLFNNPYFNRRTVSNNTLYQLVAIMFTTTHYNIKSSTFLMDIKEGIVFLNFKNKCPNKASISLGRWNFESSYNSRIFLFILPPHS